jgi:hypothetical protein
MSSDEPMHAYESLGIIMSDMCREMIPFFGSIANGVSPDNFSHLVMLHDLDSVVRIVWWLTRSSG